MKIPRKKKVEDCKEDRCMVFIEKKWNQLSEYSSSETASCRILDNAPNDNLLFKYAPSSCDPFEI